MKKRHALALLTCFGALLWGLRAEATDTDNRKKCVPVISGVLSATWPTDVSTDEGKAWLGHVYCGSFTGGGGGGGALGSTGSTTPAPAGAAINILRGRR